ncbi:MAG: DNA methyltransferase [Prosthecobacter sp.]|nr:DNA methyltransferase [Prosthecobacter sp.]
MRATAGDLADYADCSRQLAASPHLPLPHLKLADGHNTRQALNYCYASWRDFFNDRQLLALGWLHQAILDLPNENEREAMLAVFSGTLEFNNLFASYKGEGTGAIRHMFAHHILKPERMPIEGNIWGTPKSSGSFSGLFKTRLFRALEYQAAPFEIALNGKAKPDAERKTYGLSDSFSGAVSLEWPPKSALPRSIHISCGSSATTGLADQSVDLVVTDPPFFDNVHYSELADFFYAWQQLRPGSRFGRDGSTRHVEEVQDADADTFASKLCDVLRECRRVLKADGLLVFSYHHSRKDGWTSLAAAVAGAGFAFINAHPVRAEMSVAAPKAQAKEPIQLDSLLVCRKAESDTRSFTSHEAALHEAAERAQAKMAELEEHGFVLSANDRRVAVMGQFIACVSPQREATELADLIDSCVTEIDALAAQTVAKRAVSKAEPPPEKVPFMAAEQMLFMEQPAEYKVTKRTRSKKRPAA